MSTTRTFRLVVLLLVLALAGAAPAQGQGALDIGFYPEVEDAGAAKAVIEEPGGTLLVAGSFSKVNRQQRIYVARLTATGALDASFDPGSGPDGPIQAMVRQGDGKVIIAGGFTHVGGTDRPSVARLDSNGAVDTTFSTGTGPDGMVVGLALQGDGKILIAGSFHSVNGTTRHEVARLNASGSLDTTFDAGAATAGGSVNGLVLQGDGKVIVFGSFTSFAGHATEHVARLSSTGSVDTTFDAAPSDQVTGVALQTDDKVVIAGVFTTVGGTARAKIARLLAAGALDTTFDPGSGLDTSANAVVVQTDGKVVVVGAFKEAAGETRVRVARFNPDGSLDTTFDPGTGPDYAVSSVSLSGAGQPLIGGGFGTVGGALHGGVARLATSGSVDASFTAQIGVRASVSAVATQPDGKILIGGKFTAVGGQPRKNLARLLRDGTLDTTFVPLCSNEVPALVVQGDGRIVVSSTCRSSTGTERRGLSRLAADGSLDESFRAGPYALYGVEAIALQQDGRLLVGGTFTSVDSVTRIRVARLNLDGSLDTGFDPGTGADDTVLGIAQASSGKVLIGGLFTTVGGLSRNRIARLNATGYRDATFDPGTGFDFHVDEVHALPGGKVLAVGAFTLLNGATIRGVARLNSDGSADAFGSATGSPCAAAVVLADGKYIVGGNFDTMQGWRTPGVARLHPNGIVDETFTVGEGTTGWEVYALAVQADRKILVGGQFDSFAEISRMSLARVFGSVDPLPWSFALDRHLAAAGASNLNGIIEPGETVTVETSWRNATNGALALGSSIGPLGGTGAPYISITDSLVSYGTVASDTTADCYAATGNCGTLQALVPATRPAAHMDATLTETPSDGDVASWTVHIGDSFPDVTTGNSMYRFVETILHNDVTQGYGDGSYQPTGTVTRAQMAMFIARARAGSDADVPTMGVIPGKGAFLCGTTGVSLFTDVAPAASYCKHVHYLLYLGITQGCTATTYCPGTVVKRNAMAMFIARAMAGDDTVVPTTYSNPANGRSYSCATVSPAVFFSDIQATDQWCRHAHYLGRQVVDGCSATQYCPTSNTNRGAMAKFLTNGFALAIDETGPEL